MKVSKIRLVMQTVEEYDHYYRDDHGIDEVFSLDTIGTDFGRISVGDKVAGTDDCIVVGIYAHHESGAYWILMVNKDGGLFEADIEGVA